MKKLEQQIQDQTDELEQAAQKLRQERHRADTLYRILSELSTTWTWSGCCSTLCSFCRRPSVCSMA